MIFKKIFDSLSLRAVRQRLDRRKLQEELDLHRLYLLTAYHSRQGVSTPALLGDDAAATLDAEAEHLGREGTRAAVESSLNTQLTDIAETLHSILSDAAVSRGASAMNILDSDDNGQVSSTPHDDCSNKQTVASHRRTGFGAAQTPSEMPIISQSLSRLSQREVSDAFFRASGFSLYISPSSVQHRDSGDGLWIRGGADVGQIVAVYPGIAYRALHHRQIPGYPLIARSNHFLLARFDGVVMDAKPWGDGCSLCYSSSRSDEILWPVVDGAMNCAEKALIGLEGRHPLALAHFANHSPAGTLPNVVVAAVNWKVPRQRPELRPYFPVIEYEQSEGGGGGSEMIDCSIPGVVFVALRALQDEELFLNYRLNPNAPGGLPSWYSPVDIEEDERRWA